MYLCKKFLVGLSLDLDRLKAAVSNGINWHGNLLRLIWY
ncbi:MAG: hypothetical protein ACI9EH_001664, partial [Planktomarina sp.]